MKKKEVRKKPVPVAWIPVVVALLLAVNTIPNRFCLDDYCVIVNNDYVQAGLKGIPEILQTNYFNGFNRFNDGLYRPAPMVFFAIETTLFGPGPGARHAVNMLIYALTGLVLFLWMKKLFKADNDLLPLVISLLFLTHPVHTEAVANIKGRDELLAFLFAILASWQLLLYYDQGQIRRLITGLLCYILALLSKENAIAFLLIIPLMIFFFRKADAKKILKIGLPVLALTGLWLVWRTYVIRSMSAPVDSGIFTPFNNSVLSSDSITDRFATGVYLLVYYLWKLLIPIPLSHDYSFNQIPVASITALRSVLSLLVVAGILTAAVVFYKRNKAVTFSILLFLIAIAPVANLFFYIGATFAERFLYTPSLGFSIISGILLLRLLKKKTNGDSWNTNLAKNPSMTMALVILLAAYTVLFVMRNGEWKDNFTLYAADVTRSPGSARAHYNYGSELVERARVEESPEAREKLISEAGTELNTALGIYPSYLDALNNLGNLWEIRNNPDSSNACYEKILRIDSSYLKAYFNIGLNYYKMQRPEQSNRYLERLVVRDPNHAKALYLLGSNYGTLGRFDLAAQYLERCVAIDETTADAWMLLGKAYGYLQKFDKAIGIFTRILATEPGNFDANYSIAVSYRMTGKAADAIGYLQRCEQLQPANVAVLQELVACCTAAGSTAEASEYARKVRELNGTLQLSAR